MFAFVAIATRQDQITTRMIIQKITIKEAIPHPIGLEAVIPIGLEVVLPDPTTSLSLMHIALLLLLPKVLLPFHNVILLLISP